MKSFRGIVKNIDKPLICKIISKDRAGDNEAIYNTQLPFSDKESYKSFSIYGFNNTLPNDNSLPLLKLFEENVELSLGDIILLEPNGRGTVIYENNSSSNAIFLTERCNCRCVMCPQPPKFSRKYTQLSIKTISLLTDETKVLGITGGEPTLVWKGLIEVLESCKKYIPNSCIELLTNGRIFNDYEKVQELSDVKNNLSVCIPLYADVASLHDKIVGSKGAFWETLEGIYNLERMDIPVELRTVIIKKNYKRLPYWSEFIYRALPFVRHIALMGLELEGLAVENIDQVWVDPIDYMPWLEESIKILNRRDMDVSIYNHQLCTLPKNIWRFSKKAISEWKNIFIKECHDCNVMTKCGGFFKSSEFRMSRGIKPITE